MWLVNNNGNRFSSGKIHILLNTLKQSTANIDNRDEEAQTEHEVYINKKKMDYCLTVHYMLVYLNSSFIFYIKTIGR